MTSSRRSCWTLTYSLVRAYLGSRETVLSPQSGDYGEAPGLSRSREENNAQFRIMTA
jgi:hypothetical protein